MTNVTVRRRQAKTGKGADALDRRPQFAADPWLGPAATETGSNGCASDAAIFWAIMAGAGGS